MNKFTIKILVGISVVVFSCTTETNKDDGYNQTQLLKNYSDNFVSVGLNDFQLTSKKFNLAVKDFVLTKSDSSLNEVKVKWKILIDNWRICELFNIGEIKNSFLYNRIDTWNADTIDIKQILADNTQITQVLLNSKPSNNVGLYALEYLLYNTSLTRDQQFYAYLQSLAEDLEIQSSSLQNLWVSTYKSEFEKATGLSLDATISQLLNYQPIICEEVLRDKISVPLGYYNYIDLDEYTLEAWRSEYSLQIISKTISSLKKLYLGGEGEGIDDYLSFIGDTETHQKAIAYFQDAEQIINSIQEPLISTLSSEEQNLLKLRTATQKIRSLFAVDVISSIGIMGTFSDIDGD